MVSDAKVRRRDIMALGISDRATLGRQAALLEDVAEEKDAGGMKNEFK
jgi:hypothetical protein